MTDQVDRQTMLKQVRAARGALEALLAEFNDAQMTASHSPDGWSVKDVMAHIAFWEDHVLARLKEAGRGERPQLLGGITEEEVNRINQETLSRSRGRPLDEVKDEFQRAHRELINEIKAIPENEDSPWWALWPDADIPWRLIQSDTCYHYEEHMATLRVWVSGNE
jgi:hypothetical protein